MWDGEQFNIHQVFDRKDHAKICFGFVGPKVVLRCSFALSLMQAKDVLENP